MPLAFAEGLTGGNVTNIQAIRLDSIDELIIELLRKHKEGCRIAPIVQATSKSEGAIRWRLLTLEACGAIKAVRERGATTYFLNEKSA